MTNTDKHYVGETGLEIYVDCGKNIALMTNPALQVKKPDGTLVTWTAVVASYDSEYDYLLHVTILEDLDQSGEYEIQSYGQLGTWIGLGKTAKFMVYENFS